MLFLQRRHHFLQKLAFFEISFLMSHSCRAERQFASGKSDNDPIYENGGRFGVNSLRNMRACVGERATKHYLPCSYLIRQSLSPAHKQQVVES